LIYARDDKKIKEKMKKRKIKRDRGENRAYPFCKIEPNGVFPINLTIAKLRIEDPLQSNLRSQRN